MTEDQQKEAISREFLKILANGHGFKVTEPMQDHGVDLTVVPVASRTEPGGRIRLFDLPFKLDFQLKATTPRGVTEDENFIKFDLEVKNYNDLVSRRQYLLPLHLVVVVLSDAPPDCLSVNEDHLRVNGKGYWYLPDEDAQVSNNAYTVRISIPKANQLESSFVRQRFVGLGIDL